MKKIILSLFLFLFLIPTVYANGTVNFLDVEVHIDKEGNAHFLEKWGIPKQENRQFAKDFTLEEGVEIKDISLKNEKEKAFKEVDALDKLKEEEYFFENQEKNTYIHFMTKGEESSYLLSYTIPNFIVQFKDVQGILWSFIPASGHQSFTNVSLSIESDFPFAETNTALYAIGKKINAHFDEGKILLSSNEVTPTSSVVLMTSFTENSYTNPRKCEKSFQEVYGATLKKNHAMNSVLTFIKEEILFILLGIIALVLIVWSILYFLGRNKKTYQKTNEMEIVSIDELSYYDSVPCEGDLYVLHYLIECAGLLKERVNLIDAILLKWIFEKRVSIVKTENVHTLRFKENQLFSNFLDSDLYECFISSSAKYGLDKLKLSKYCEVNEKELYHWFKNNKQVVIEEAKKQGLIKEVKKFGKVKFVLGSEYLEDIEKIRGVKKYLLYFNQVPRQSKLTIEKYKELLIMAELLGIGGQVSKEILRKNPNNALAHLVQEFELVRPIYENLYDDVLKYHKESKKKKKDEDIDLPRMK